MKKHRVALVLGVAAALFAPALALPAQQAFAEADPPITTYDSHDRFYSFTFPGTRYSDWAPKDNATSMYLRVDMHNGGPVFIDDYGASNNIGSGARKCTQGTPVVTYEGEFEVYNSVYESGLRWSQMRAYSNLNGTMRGYWSPDCVGHFHVLS